MIASFVRTVLLYLLLVGMIRLLGKRQIGQMEPAEFVVTMMAANLCTAPIEDPGSPLIYSLIAILTILGAELTVSMLTLRSVTARRLLCGRPVILIEDGVPLQENLKKTRVSMDELISQLREKEILELSAVQYAILETNGSLSVIPFAGERPATAREAGITPRQSFLPVTLIEDGCILEGNLEEAGKNEAWVRGVLRDRGAAPEDTLLLTVDPQGHIVFLRKEGRT